MMIDPSVLRREEEATLRLRTLYQQYGYTAFKMSKFEEYDLYAHNKEFLTAKHAITFTDTDGTLLALKPDVTLSIIKNSRDTEQSLHKVCYHENVYRISDFTHTWREIPQVGLECLGVIDRYQKGEVLCLAAKSLALLSSDYIMDISHIGMLQGALETVDSDPTLRDAVLQAIGQKNTDAIHALVRRGALSDFAAATVLSLLLCDGPFANVLPQLDALCVNSTMQAAADELKHLYDLFRQEPDMLSHLRLDFSVINSMNYYSGLLFQGFVPGIPERILSGGQYDNLMKKMGRRANGIGFAVYPDLLQYLPCEENRRSDTDILLLYRETDSPLLLHRAVQALIAQGVRVRCATAVPDKMTFGRVMRLEEWEEWEKTEKLGEKESRNATT